MKYTVTLEEREIYVFPDIEAQDEQDAIMNAWNIFTEENKVKHHYDTKTGDCSAEENVL